MAAFLIPVEHVGTDIRIFSFDQQTGFDVLDSWAAGVPLNGDVGLYPTNAWAELVQEPRIIDDYSFDLQPLPGYEAPLQLRSAATFSLEGFEATFAEAPAALAELDGDGDGFFRIDADVTMQHGTSSSRQSAQVVVSVEGDVIHIETLLGLPGSGGHDISDVSPSEAEAEGGITERFGYLLAAAFVESFAPVVANEQEGRAFEQKAGGDAQPDWKLPLDDQAE